MNIEARHLTCEVRAVDGEAGGSRRWRVVASTGMVDRMDDVIDQASWQIGPYSRNPVILWGHNMSEPPIGRAVSTAIEQTDTGPALVVEFEIDAADGGRGAEVAGKLERGFLRAVSVGFLPRRYTRRSELPDADPRKGPRGVVYLDCELLELSVVSVPANADALLAASADADRAGLLAALREVLPEALGSVLDDPAIAHRIAGAVYGSQPSPDPDPLLAALAGALTPPE